MGKRKVSQTHPGLDGAEHRGTKRRCPQCARAYMRLWRADRFVMKPGDPVRIKAICNSLVEGEVIGRLIGPVLP